LQASAGADASADLRHPDTTVRQPLYNAEQRRRRDETPWTLVQGVLAPVQFLACLVSIVLVSRFLGTGSGETAATVSIIVKTFLLYSIMVTGCLWEKAVYDRYLFAGPFFWEDVVSMGVIALHTAYLAALAFDGMSVRGRMYLALAAYALYVVNATQFLLKLRAARLSRGDAVTGGPALAGAME
jgi:3-vinyl bacteriochlorophyllide hydratase